MGITNKEKEYNNHKPVLIKEVIEGLAIKKDGIYIDATFGRGGHSKEILQHLDVNGRLICIDKDDEAIQAAKKINDQRVIIKHCSFAEIDKLTKELGFKEKISGILLDLGVSSPQLDNKKRGFSFMQDGELDMRMDQTQKLNAATWINQAQASQIAQVLKEYGEERHSKKIAQAIIKERELKPITTTKRLVEIVSLINKQEKHKHPATRTFQAIRIFINNELQELSICLDKCLEILAVGGRLAVISFHSLEDRIVKRFMQKNIVGNIPMEIPLPDAQIPRRLKYIKRLVKASKNEVQENIRSRSAVLRIAEKIL